MSNQVTQVFIDEDLFMKMRERELAIWPTGKEVDLEEAVEYQKQLPESRNFCKVTRQLGRQGRTVVFPRAGYPLIEEEIELNRTLSDTGIPLIPITTDSYTRLLRLEKVEEALAESRRTGKSMINGYPIINHGVAATRRVTEAVEAAYNLRLGGVEAQKLGAEIGFAAGITTQPPSIFQTFANYDKKTPLGDCIKASQYVFRLMGYYAERGPVLTADIHGWNPNAVFPLSVHIATIVLTALIGAEQGVKSIIPLIELQGNIAQDLAWYRVGKKLVRDYLDKAGHADVIIPGVFANQIPLYPVPMDQGGAFAYLTYTAFVAALAKAEAGSVRTIDEAFGIATKEAHAASYRAAHWIFNVVRTQNFEFDSDQVNIEEEMATKEVRAIVDKVLEMGDGDAATGSVRALEAGVLDSPFAANIHIKDNVMGVRDLQGACRFLEFGQLPLPDDVKAFHREKVAERQAAENVTMDYKVYMQDFWAFSKGTLKGMPPY
jgi:methylaspartate mutase epsilon subunit